MLKNNKQVIQQMRDGRVAMIQSLSTKFAKLRSETDGGSYEIKQPTAHS
jgi:hypothetical protein